MPGVTVTSGAPDIADGVYPVILVEVKGNPNDPESPKTVTAQRGPNAGQDVELWDWRFEVATPGQPGDEVVLQESTSTASGPRSKMFAYITALRSGQPPRIGENIRFEELYGRAALATVQKDGEGWPRIVNLGAMPVAMQQQRLAQVAGAPVQLQGAPAPAAAAPTPLRQQVAGQAPDPGQFAGSPAAVADGPRPNADDLPF